jgi:[Skp1-protein]-hydroxyproline N-acetylglucosaminyltransferase
MQQPEPWDVALHAKIPGTIFVSVASYRDDECKDTVFDMFAKAKHPNNVFVGVVQQNSDEKKEDCFDKCPDCAVRKQSGHIRVTNFSHMDAKGPTFARYHASKLWRGEEYYLQIDSHLKFEQDWDVTLLQQMKATGDPKAVLGHYPPTEAQMKEMKANNFSTMVTMCAAGDLNEDGIPVIEAQIESTDGSGKPPKIPYTGAGLVCMPGTALYDVPFDPYLSYVFHMEEQLFSARLWTHGYNIYAPTKAFASHHYGREGKPKYSTDHGESAACRRHAVQRGKYYFGMAKKEHVHPDYMMEIDKYGMGKKRTLAAFWKATGGEPGGRLTKVCRV